MPNRGKTGAFCSTYAKQTAPKTDTPAMRTRVNPVILYERTVILGSENPKGHLRISEKKNSEKKTEASSAKFFPFRRNLKKYKKTFFLGSLKFSEQS
jgi:hypothetical protein